MTRSGILAVLALALVTRAGTAQSLELEPVQARGNVGDILSIRITARLHPGQELLELVPRPLLPPPEGMRIVSTDTLTEQRDGSWTGGIRMAFYRIGRQPVPTLALLYRPAANALPDTLVNAPLSIEITPILPLGNPSLKDIKPLEQLGGPVVLPLILLLTGVGAAVFWLFRRRNGVAPLWTRRAPAAPIHTPFAAALARLDALEQEVLASGNGVVPSYARVAEIMRDALIASAVVPHSGFTSGELRAMLPGPLTAEGAGDRFAALLADADLVKFAKLRPDLPSAQGQIARARALFTLWDASTTSPPVEG